MKKILTILLLLLLPPLGAIAGTVDDFEGGVNWGNTPWETQFPLWQIDDGESSVTDTMCPEWKLTFGDQTAGPDFGYIQHDHTKGAAGTGKSLKFTITGGNIATSQVGKVVYGQGPIGTIYMTGQPLAGQTFSVDGVTFTMQTAARSGAGQVQIGASTLATAENMAAAINADISTTNVHAVANGGNGYDGMVTISQAGTTFPTPTEATVVSELLTYATYYQTPSNQGMRSIYSEFPSLISSGYTGTAGGFYLMFGSVGGSLTLGNNVRLVVPPEIMENGVNKLSFYVYSPTIGSIYTDAIEQGISFGTYINNQDRWDASCTAPMYHMYHNAILMKSDYWQKIIIDENPDHTVGETNPYTPNNPTRNEYIPTCNATNYPMDYMESLQYFYVDQVTKWTTTNPTSIWFDEFKIYSDGGLDTAKEYVANRSIAYIGDNRIVIGWTGRWGTVASGAPADYTIVADDYKIYYSTSQLNASNFSTTGTLAGSYTRASGSKLARAIITIPDYDVDTTYYFAISPDNEPTTASFIDYKAEYQIGQSLGTVLLGQ